MTAIQKYDLISPRWLVNCYDYDVVVVLCLVKMGPSQLPCNLVLADYKHMCSQEQVLHTCAGVWNRGGRGHIHQPSQLELVDGTIVGDMNYMQLQVHKVTETMPPVPWCSRIAVHLWKPGLLLVLINLGRCKSSQEEATTCE